MNARRTSRQHIHRLLEIRNRFDSDASREKLELLKMMRAISARSSAELRLLHTALCFIRAFPDTAAHYRLAHMLLAGFEERVHAVPATVQSELWDTGIIGTVAGPARMPMRSA